MAEENEGVGFEGGNEDQENLTVNLGDVEESSGFQPLPRGNYDAEVEECEFQYSQRSGNPMWSFRFNITEGEYANRKLFYHVTFTENDLPRVKRTLIRLGRQDLADSQFNPKQVAEEGELIGLECRLKVTQRQYQGEWRNNVQDVLKKEEDGGSTFANA